MYVLFEQNQDVVNWLRVYGQLCTNKEVGAAYQNLARQDQRYWYARGSLILLKSICMLYTVGQCIKICI